MNQLLLFALMNGSHRHRYTDASGICAACHRPHSPHTFENGVCAHERGVEPSGNARPVGERVGRGVGQFVER